jgi:hypothetical protein
MAIVDKINALSGMNTGGSIEDSLENLINNGALPTLLIEAESRGDYFDVTACNYKPAEYYKLLTSKTGAAARAKISFHDLESNRSYAVDSTSVYTFSSDDVENNGVGVAVSATIPKTYTSDNDRIINFIGMKPAGRAWEETWSVPRQITYQLLNRTLTEFTDKNNAVYKVRDGAFNGCSQLTSIHLPVATSIGNHAFAGCSSLTSISLPSAESIGDTAFAGCTQLTAVSLPAVKSTGFAVFMNCSQLTSVSLPAATSIDGGTFHQCPNLTTIILGNTSGVATLSVAYAFTNTPNAIVYVPDELVDSYKSATNWSNYASRIKGISELQTA